MSLSAIILTRNEEGRIGACLQSLRGMGECLVVDSGSTDRTCSVAMENGAKVITHPFVNFASQRNAAMEYALQDWTLFIDADEQITPGLRAEIEMAIRQPPAAYRLPRMNYFFGKKLSFSGGQQDAPLRLFPRGSGKWVQPVHEYFSTDLPVLRLKSHLEHHSTRDLTHYLEKMRCYMPLEIETMKKLNRKVSFLDSYFRSVAKFFYLYFFKLGFLDGIVGIQFAALSAYYDFKKWSLYCARSDSNLKIL